MRRFARQCLVLSVAAVLAACGGGSGDNPATGPVIATAPVSSTLNAGGTVTLSVVATGTGTLSYQWKRDGVDIAGATASTYTTPPLAVGDSGQAYTVEVRDTAGQATTSTAAVLTVNAAATTKVALTQESADTLVADVNAGVASLRQANATNALPLGSQTLALPLGATVEQTLDCSDLGVGAGSGSINFTINSNDSTGQPVSSLFSYNNCNIATGDFNYLVNGTGEMTYTNWTSATSYSFRLAYNMTYRYSSGTYNDEGTLNSVQVCTINGEQEDCSFSFGDDQVRDVSLNTSGSVTTVSDARISNSLVDCVYSGWVFDASNGRATSGTVTVTAPNGDRAVIAASSTGYTVDITVGATTSRFTVAFPT